MTNLEYREENKEANRRVYAEERNMRYLIIYEDHTLEQHDVLTGKLRTMARRGEISLVDTKEMRGLNAYGSEFTGDWSDILPHTGDESANG